MQDKARLQEGVGCLEFRLERVLKALQEKQATDKGQAAPAKKVDAAAPA